MKFKNKYWFTMVYIMIIITMILSLWVIVINKQSHFENTLENRTLETIFLKSINSKFALSYNYHIANNSNWGGYDNIIKCPNNVKFLSWSEIKYTWITSHFFIDEVNRREFICSWSLNWQNLNLYYSWTNTFWTWFYWQYFPLVWNASSMTWVLDSTYSINFSFSGSDYSGLDKNKDSDNYKVTSNLDNYYPNNKIDDDDAEARKKIFWFIPNDWNYYNIFSNIKEVVDIIDKNTNNNDLVNKKIWLVNSWALKLDIDNAFDLKIIKFDKDIYLNNKTLVKKSEFDIYNSSWALLYLTWNTFSWNLNWWQSFDFINNFYWFFLKTWSWVSTNYIKYNLEIFDESWSGVYIVPFKDDQDKIEYLWNDIIKYNWKFIYYLYKITKLK